ncbi:MAG: hypothetical protein C4560_07520 [Nitrospiraceae bacterium]|nr:MAG: hypothetical protein C4560_07520 [Nitrospiraceae bacterium]
MERIIGMHGNNKKVIVVGLDGATFTLLEQFVQEGRMPNFQKILREGVSGILQSTVPPVTAPAWCSFATGKNPGKHGAHDFIVKNKDNEMVIINSQRIKGKKIWDILGDYNKKVGVIHFPISYPPEKVNGFMLSGFISPPNKKNYSYPEELYPDLLKETGEYIFNVKVPEKKNWQQTGLEDIRPFIDKLYHETELRYKAYRYLKRKHDCDFWYLLFMSFDKIQHVLWKFLDINCRNHDRGKIFDYIIKCYEQIDGILGHILSELDNNTSMIVLSDHGFGPKDKWLYVNVWLEKNGFLQKNLVKLVKEKVKEKLGFRSGKYFEGIPAPTVKRHEFLNLQRTKAYSPNSSSYGIFINLKGREKSGIVEKGKDYERLRNELRDRLLSYKDDETGTNVIDEVYFSDQIYHGPFQQNAPDLILCPAYGYMIIDSFSVSGKCLVKVDVPEGTHRPEGIFIAANNKDLMHGARINDINIIDIAPTILYLMGLPIPSDMDGKIIAPMFNDAFLKSNSPVFTESEAGTIASANEDVYSEEDDKQIRDSLKGLGYLD